MAADANNEFWTGWAEKLPPKVAIEKMATIRRVDQLAGFAFKNRWLLNRKRPGARELNMGNGHVIIMRCGQTLTHYHALECVRAMQKAKHALIEGRSLVADLYIKEGELAVAHLHADWLHSFASLEAKRVRGIQEGELAHQGAETREKIKKIIETLPEDMRHSRELTALVCERTGLGRTQARAHIQALAYGSKRRKRSA